MADMSSETITPVAALAAVFIDGGYLDKLLDHEHNSVRVDFDRIATEMQAGLSRFRAYYYH